VNDIVNTDMREFWNGAGAEKWLRFHEKMDANLLPFGQKAMAAAAVLPGEAVLDVGCGCGDTSFQIAGGVGPGGRVLGVDISEPLLARGIERAASNSGKNVAFEYGDAQILAFEAGAFDVIFSRFGVMFFDDPVAAFKNLRRALRAGGRVAFICWQATKANQWIAAPLEIVAKHVPLLEPAGPEDPGPLSLADPDRVTRILTASGFRDVAINGFETAFSVGDSVDEAVAFLMQMGPASSAIAQSGVDDTVKSKIAADLRDALNPPDAAAGVTMGSATWVVTARNP